MQSSWVDAVWEESQKKKTHADSEQFKKFRCLPFHKLNICSTGNPSIEDRTELAKKVEDNGGIFQTILVLEKADILIVYGSKYFTSSFLSKYHN